METIGTTFRFSESCRAGYIVESTVVPKDGDTILGVERLWSVCDDKVYCGYGADRRRRTRRTPRDHLWGGKWPPHRRCAA